MRTILLLCFTWPALVATAQQSAIDAYARSLPFRGEKDLIRITDSLTNRYAADHDRARAIFVWITEHIAYDCGSENRLLREPTEAVHPLYYTQQQVENILRTRRTRCDGYAFLFKTMCRLAGIYATDQEGYARFDGRSVDPATVQPNHVWSAVCLDGVWQEVDLTAAAGQCSGSRFVRERHEEFFPIGAALHQRLYIPIDDSRSERNQGVLILKLRE